GFGGTKNIPADYRNGAKRLVFSGGYVQRELNPGEIRREGSVVYDDIYPQRTAAVGTVSGDGLGFTDNTLDFDLNDQFLSGSVAKVVFKSGELMGQEFEIASYDHDTKTITFKINTDANGYEMPNATFQLKEGDLYTLVGIEMPQTYI